MGALFDTRDADRLSDRNLAPGPPATRGESVLSAWENVTTNTMTIARDMLLRAEYERYLERVEVATGETFDNPLDAPRVPGPFILEETNPALERFLAEQPDRPRLSIARPRAQVRQKTPRERGRDLFAELTRLKVEKFPELEVRTPEDIEAAIGRQRAEARTRRAGVAAREDALGAVIAFATEAGGMMLDPPVLASMAYGAPLASGILRGALIDAGIGAAVEVPIQASLQATRARFGERTSLSEAALNVLTGGAGGFIFSGLIRGAVKGTRAVVHSVRENGLARIRKERDALAFLERQVDLEDATPFNRANVEKKIIGISRIFLTMDGRKAPLSRPKMALGALRGGAVRLAPTTDRVWLTEGVEDDRPGARAEHEDRLSEAEIVVRAGRAPRQDEPRTPLRRELTDRPADPGPGATLRETFSFEEGPLRDFEDALKANGARRREQARADGAEREAGKRLAAGGAQPRPGRGRPPRTRAPSAPGWRPSKSRARPSTGRSRPEYAMTSTDAGRTGFPRGRGRRDHAPHGGRDLRRHRPG